MKFLMCRPEFYGIEYEINPWMNIKEKVNHALAVAQWENLYQTMLKCGAQVELVSPVKGWPDMVFTANAGLLYQHKIILTHFKFKERQGEMPYFKKWFEEAGYETVDDNTILKRHPLSFEGAGDALLAGEKLFVGYGFRSEKKFFEEASWIKSDKLIYCELANPYFYHIDTCFCPLNENQAIYYPGAFTAASCKKMAEKIELIPVNEEEAKRFACNAVVIDKHIVLPTQCPEITATLEQQGFTVHACDMDQYLKAGGACKCLTLRID